ncbi:MAG: hypothetical protein RLZZ428_1098 [Pseudomonadota bacterium]
MKIDLNENLFIGEGRNRKCYYHPIQRDRCVKISSPKGKRSSQREINYYKRLKKRGISFEMIARYIGPINTNIGDAEVYELIRDTNGKISQSLESYLHQHDPIMNQAIVKLIEEFRQYLKKEKILFSDFGLGNLLIQHKNDQYKLIAIDGVGDNNQIPFLEYISFLATKRNVRKWDTFISEVSKVSPLLGAKIKRFDEI